MEEFNDRKLEYLLKLAVEAEELESSADMPALRYVAGSTRPQRKWLMPLAGLMAAAAAGVAVTTVVLPMIKPAAPVTPPIAKGPESPSPTHAKVPIDVAKASRPFDKPILPDSVPVTSDGTEESSVVLAFFQGVDGQCSCMHIQKEDWDAAQLSGKDRGQLLDLAFHSTCTQPSSKVLIVGISAPANSLPTSQEAAEALAAKLSDTFNGARVDLVSRAYEAMPQLPAGSTVVAESFGHGRGYLLQPAKWTGQ
jgi:hypothetical protein